MKIESVVDLFQDKSVRVIGICADPNAGKSNLIYDTIQKLQERYDAKIYTYGLRAYVPGTQVIYSVEELEKIHNSIIFIDEFYSLFELTNRKKTEQVEKSLRLIYHKNNIMVLCGLPHNFNKFISGMLNAIVFKACTLVDFINRSYVQRVAFSYKNDAIMGQSTMSIPKDEAVIFDGEHYTLIDVPYVEFGDTKRNNPSILIEKQEAKLSLIIDEMIKA
jgi:hypothetical protein